MERIRLSAAVITKNEEDKIGDCLASLSFADEIVVVDSGSTDRTVEIAKSMGANVVFHEWPGHIQQKNFAIGQARGEWVISLDADERVSPRLRDEILKVLGAPKADGYAIPRLVHYINRWIRHCGWYPARKVRLFRRDKGKWGGENPHDRLFVEGKVEDLNGDIYHLSFDDISEHLRTINSFTDIAAAERGEKPIMFPWLSMILRPKVTFIKMYFLKLGFLDGVPGLIASGLSAYHVFCKYMKIWERQSR
ncbi:MAG: glycosyltransferase family 2 protein [Nitrospinae bacterium]|nr:glycosyltransferase family 2 protein [Nitrospinota bacterium]